MSLALLLTLALAGCSGSNSGSEGSGDDGGKINIDFWHSMKSDNKKALEKIIDDFNDQSDSIHVKPVFQGDYPESLSKLRAVGGSEEAPALIQIYDLGTKYMSDSGFVTPVEKFIKDDDDFDKDKILDAPKAYYSVDGKLNSMPFNSSTTLMYYNKDLFKKAGLDPDNPPETYEKIEDAAKKIKDETGNTGFTFATIGWFFEELLANQGELYLNNDNGRKGEDPTEALVNKEGGVKIFDWLDDMNKAGSFKNYGSDWEDPRGPFQAGQVGIMFGSTGVLQEMINNSDFDVGTAYLPVPEGTDRQGLAVGGASTWITNKVSDEEQEAAWEVIKYMTSPEEQAEWAKETGYFPVNEDSYDLDVMDDLYDKYPQYKTAVDQLRSTKQSPATAGALTESMPENREDIEAAMGELYKGADSQEALDKAKGKIDKNLKK